MDVERMRIRVVGMIDELRMKMVAVPERGEFPLLYSEFKNDDRSLCLTDIMLTVRSLPDYLDNYETERWLSVTGYRLPAPYKSSMVILKGDKDEILRYLGKEEAVERILELIPRLDCNLSDV